MSKCIGMLVLALVLATSGEAAEENVRIEYVKVFVSGDLVSAHAVPTITLVEKTAGNDYRFRSFTAYNIRIVVDGKSYFERVCNGLFRDDCVNTLHVNSLDVLQ